MSKPKSVIVYLPPEVYEQVRRFAYLQKTSMSKVMLNAFQDVIKLSAKSNEA